MSFDDIGGLDGVISELEEAVILPLARPDLYAHSAVAQGVHELAYDSIVKCDNVLQRDLFQNIVLAGGTSMLEGALHDITPPQICAAQI